MLFQPCSRRSDPLLPLQGPAMLTSYIQQCSLTSGIQLPSNDPAFQRVHPLQRGQHLHRVKIFKIFLLFPKTQIFEILQRLSKLFRDLLPADCPDNLDLFPSNCQDCLGICFRTIWTIVDSGPIRIPGSLGCRSRLEF